jgi:hypothetical protein
MTFFDLVTDSSTNIISRKTKSKNFSDMEGNNIYAGTPPKMKPTTLVSILQQRRPPVPIRTDSTRSVGSTTISTISSQSVTPSNSFRHDPSIILNRSVDASSSGLMNQVKNGINNMKSKSTYDIETSILTKNFTPLQSVKEDEFLEIDNNNNEKYSKVRNL